MTQNKRAIIKMDIDSMERLVDKCGQDYMVISDTIDYLINTRGRLTQEIIVLNKRINERTAELEGVDD